MKIRYYKIFLISAESTQRESAYRSAVTLAFINQCWARSDSPFSVITRSGLNLRMFLQMRSIYSSSTLRSVEKSSGLIHSTFVMLSPYNKLREWTQNVAPFCILAGSQAV